MENAKQFKSPSERLRFRLSGINIAIMMIIPVIVYSYPRALVAAFGKDSPWTSYLYMYGFGLITFLIGMYIIMKSGSLKLGRGHDGFWFKWLVGGYIFFAALHGSWIYFGLTMPYLGGK